MKLSRLAFLLLLIALPSAATARWIDDKVLMPSEATGPVEFSHYSHLDALGKDCPTCHNAIFNIVPAKNPVFTMADMEKGKSCGACHNGTKAFSVKGNEGCSNCHPTKDIFFDNDAGKVLFSHKVHTAAFGCGECHPAMFVPSAAKKPMVTMTEMEKGASCGACHDGGTAFTVKENCEVCHQM